jgi:cell division septum initiation protein DivIVA
MPNLEEQLRTATFPTVRKGLNPEAVSEFLDVMADAVAALDAEARADGVRVRRLERQLTELQGIGSDPSAVFLSASEAKERLLAEAKVKAEEILAEARATSVVNPDEADSIRRSLEEAEVIESAARTIAEQILAEARLEASRIVTTARLNTQPPADDLPETLQQYG